MAAHPLAMKIKSGNRPKKPKQIMYVCNRQRCKDCIPECKWTADEAYALYDYHTEFTPEAAGLFEVIRK